MNLFDLLNAGKIDEFKKEINFFTDINKVSDNKSLLYYACESENPNTEVIKMILDYGAKVNYISKRYGKSILEVVCEKKVVHAEVIRLLLKYGANPNFPFVKNSIYKIVMENEKLLENSVSREIIRGIVVKKEDVAEVFSSNKFRMDIMKIMFENARPELNEEFLYYSVNSKNEKALKYLLEHKINPNKIKTDSSLMYTLQKNIKLFEIFLYHGADPNAFVTNYIPRKYILEHAVEEGLIRQSISLIYYGAVFRSLHCKKNFFRLVNIPEMEQNEIIPYLYKNNKLNLFPTNFQSCFYFLIVAKKKRIPKPLVKMIVSSCLKKDEVC